MTDTKKKEIVNPLAAAALGAGVAITRAIALKDEKNRKKIKSVLNDLKSRGEEISDYMNKDAGKKVGEIKDKTEEIKDEAEKKNQKLSS